MRVHSLVIAALGLIVGMCAVDAQASVANSLHGAVVDADGTMVNKFTVLLRPLSDKPILIQRKRFFNGIFLIDSLDRQKYEVVVSAPDYIGVRMKVDFPKNGGATELKIVILHPLVKYLPGNPEAVYDNYHVDDNVSEIAKLRYRRGVELHRSGKLEEALAAYGDAMRLAPGYVAPLVGAGIVYLLLDRLDAGIGFLRQAEQLAPRDTGIKLNIAAGLLLKNDMSPAIKILESLARQDHDKAIAYVSLARAYYLQRKYQQAEKMVQRALAEDPGLIEPRQILLSMALEQKNYVAAREHLLKLRDSLHNQTFSGFVDDQMASMN